MGEGLCSRGGDSGSIVIQTVVLGNGGDLFVGGNFATRVWDGHHFVYVYHVAQFDAKASAWLPLEGGGELRCDNSELAGVNALAWDAESSILYIGGRFHSVEGRKISSGLVIWSPTYGLESFPGPGVTSTINEPYDAEVNALAFEPTTKSLFISGTFNYLNGSYCPSVVVWSRILQSWKCLLDDQDYRFGTITAMALDRNYLFVAGWTNSPGWKGNEFRNNHGIARLSIKGLIEELEQWMVDKIKDKPKQDNNESLYMDTNVGQRRHRRLHIFRRNSTTNRRRLRNHNPIVSFKSSDSSTKHPTLSPTLSPSSPPVALWEPIWDWLPNFEGANGPILKLVPGKHDLEGSLFIGGSFNNMPALVIWNAYPNRYGYGNITVIGGKRSLDGLVTAMAEIFLPAEPVSTDDSVGPDYSKRDYTFVILLACVGLGVLMGLCFTISCFSRFPYPDSPTDDDVNNSGENTIGAISLKTLSDGQGNAVDFKECFERAMKFRHLPTYETLIIINPKEILLSKIIGEGSFGRVWSGQWRNNAVAVKEFVFAQAAIAGGSLQRNNIIEEIVGEAGVMACLRHPKILQLYGCSLTMQAIWIVSELCGRGSLKMILMDHKQDLPILKRLSICMDVADGMQYLHNRTPPIIHRDLKSHNIFITEPSPGHFVAKIGDWGSARAVQLTGSKSMTQGVGTACWLSPEVINNAHFSKSSDVYAFGIILWEVFTRQEIYEGLSAAQIIAKVAHEGLRPQVPRNCPWSKVMTKCWRQDPSDRPDFEAILTSLTNTHQKYALKLKEKHGSGSGGTPVTANIPATIYERDGSGCSSGTEDYFQQSSVSKDESVSLVVNPLALVTPERVGLKSSQDIGMSSSSKPNTPTKRNPKLYDAFHPSLENLRMLVHDEHSRSAKEPVESSSQYHLSSSRSIDTAAHLAPEIAQMQSLLLDEHQKVVTASSSKNNSNSSRGDFEVEVDGTKSAETPSHFVVSMDKDADPIDFLFNSRAKAKK